MGALVSCIMSIFNMIIVPIVACIHPPVSVQSWHAHLVTTRDGTRGNYRILHKIIYCTFENVGFRTNFGVQGKEILSWHVPNLKELNCKICPSSFIPPFFYLGICFFYFQSGMEVLSLT